jgi:predicted Zn-dependent peptidase
VPIAAIWGREWEDWTPAVWGIGYSSEVRSDSTLEVLRSTGTDVGATLRHLRHLLGFSTMWPPREFTQRLDVYQREDRMPAVAFDRALARAVFGANPLGARPTPAEIGRITPRAVLRWTDRLRRPRNAALVIVGDFDPTQALADVQAQIGEWGSAAAGGGFAQPPAFEQTAAPPDSDARLILQDQPSAQQATLRVLCPLPRASAGTAAAALIFRSGVEAALFDGLREELGASYSVNSRVNYLLGGTAEFELFADVDYARLPQVIRRVRTLLADPGTPFLDPAALARARAHVAAAARLNTREMAIDLFDWWNLGWPLDFRDRLPRQAMATRDEDVLAVAGHCRENAVIGVLGDRARTSAAWVAATH